MGVFPVQSCVFGKVAVVVEIHSRMLSVFIGCAAARPRNMIIESDVLRGWNEVFAFGETSGIATYKTIYCTSVTHTSCVTAKKMTDSL